MRNVIVLHISDNFLFVLKGEVIAPSVEANVECTPDLSEEIIAPTQELENEMLPSGFSFGVSTDTSNENENIGGGFGFGFGEYNIRFSNI